ncbi:MAG: Zn-dependent oxidoreductase [Acidimicrobiales bacterium]|nr:Zn-dependent oxidoreductase [Acidimicrobiales bacterium]
MREIEVPEVGPGEVRVSVGAASINFGDTARTRGGVATVQIPPPFTLGMDVCGVVEAAGEGAEHWVGKRVVAMTKMSFGGMAEHAICVGTGVFDAPAELDDAEATAFLLPFHTSYLGLHKRAKLQSGETVLVIGAASGVGTAAVQLAAAAGANVIAVAGGAEKGDYCRGLGATASIDYTCEDLFDRVMELTDGRGAEVVFDLVGGPQTETTWTCVAREGRYLPVGFNGEAEGGLSGKPLRKVSLGNFAVLGVLLAYSPGMPAMRKFGMNPFPPETGAEVHAALSALVTAGSIRPAIGRRVTMADVAQTLEDHEQRLTHGRSVVEIAGS